MERLTLRAFIVVAVLLGGATLLTQSPATAQAPTTTAGPPEGLGVQVLGGTVQIDGGTVGVTGTVAATQSGTWTVNVAAPEIYTERLRPQCVFLNVCVATFTAVPAGQVLRVSAIVGFMRFQSNDAFVALHAGSGLSAATVLFTQPVPLTTGFYYGNALSFNIATDVVFTAGQTPSVEVAIRWALPISRTVVSPSRAR